MYRRIPYIRSQLKFSDVKEKKIGLFIFVFLLFTVSLKSQIKITGVVKDSISGEVLIGAHVFENGTTNAVSSDNQGFFSIFLESPSGIEISFVGYNPKTFDIKAESDTFLSISLVPGADLDEVIVRAHRKESLSFVSISRKEMLLTPTLGATPDVLKTIQYQPGIQSQNEGSSLLLVRGGNPGENLYLLDNVPLIYVNHLGGFMSVFNPEMINNLTLYKGGFPSKYGGKLSSIVDITQLEGNQSEFKGSVGIGLTDASFKLEGPIKGKKLTCIVSGRKTFTDLLMLGASSIADGDYLVSYGFHDINSKISWRPDSVNSIQFNLYQGDDYLNFWLTDNTISSNEKSRIANTWGNWMASTKWSRIFSNRLFLVNTLSYTRYRLKYENSYYFDSPDENYQFQQEFISTVKEFSLSSEWRYKAWKKVDLEYGFLLNHSNHNPSARSESENTGYISGEGIESNEASLYLEGLFSINENSRFRAGLRWVNYFLQGYQTSSIEPRLKLDISLFKNLQLNFGYMRVSQNSHLLFTNQSLLNNEVWIPADRDIPSSISDQMTLGWNINLNNNMYELGMEFYYKELRNLATYREGYSNILGDENWKSKIITGGNGRGYGVEFIMAKTRGKFNGYLSYTYSRAFRSYDGINDGSEYIFEYDRPHSGSLRLNYEFSNNLTISAVWIFQSGLPYTPAIGRQYIQSMEYMDGDNPFLYEALIYGERNSERMKDYHRLDIALTYSYLTKKKKLNANWVLSVYNVYNRQNPYYYYFNVNSGSELSPPSPSRPYQPVSLYQISFFPIIPSISYKVNFDANSFKKSGERKKIKEKLSKWLYYE